MTKRHEIENVFCLGGGELHEEHPDFPDEWKGIFEFWYEGTPEYATEIEDDHECRTAIVCELFGEVETPEGWERVAHWTSSGEAECWHCEGKGYERVELKHGSCNEPCESCEGDKYVYIGDGWREVVYRTIQTED